MRPSLIDKAGSIVSGLLKKIGASNQLISNWDRYTAKKLIEADQKLPVTAASINELRQILNRRADTESGQDILFKHYADKYFAPAVEAKGISLISAYNHLLQLHPTYRQRSKNWAYRQALSQAEKGKDAGKVFDAILKSVPEGYREDYIQTMALKMPHDAFGAWMQTTESTQNLIAVSKVVKRVLTVASIDAWCLEGPDWDLHANAQTLLHKILGTDWLGQATNTSVDSMEKKAVAGFYEDKFVVLSPRLSKDLTSVLAFAYDMDAPKLFYVTSGVIRSQKSMARLISFADEYNEAKTDLQAKARFKAFAKASRRLLTRQRQCRPAFLTALKAKMPQNHPFQRIRSVLWAPTR